MSDPSLRVLFVTPECGPLVKTGGLGDVAASLGRALREAGIDLRWLLPRYANLAELAQRSKRVARLAPEFDFPAAALLEHRGEDPSPLYLLDCPELYARPGGPYQDPASGEDWPDNALRFGLLSRVGALLARDASPLAWRAQLVHCNDWQSGLTPAYLRHAVDATAASVMTVHNLA